LRFVTIIFINYFLELGTGRSDFHYQLEGDNAFDFEKFTIVAVELPGWGRSRPPSRPYGTDVFNNDAECCVKLMQVSNTLSLPHL
jgi:pimeloyl-ACP methyl ester carboxylesterase